MRAERQDGGSLVHSREFRLEHYMGADGRPHYEVLPADGDYDVISYTTWNELKRYAVSLGVPPEVWPDFSKYQDTIDLPLDEVVAVQGPLAAALDGLPADVVAGNPLLDKIVGYLRKGEQVFFC